MEQSKKIRQNVSGYIVAGRYLRLIVCIVLVVSIWPFQAGLAGNRVAIFDFDKREVSPDELNRFIETKLREVAPDIEVEHFSGCGDEAQSVRLLREIEAEKFDLAIVRTSDALIIAQHTLFNTPTLYTNVNNPLLLGFKTLGPPGGNISGASYYIPVKKRLKVYKAIMPTLHNPGFIFDKNNKSRKVEIPEAREACAALGMHFEVEFIEGKGQLHRAANTLILRGVDAILAASSGTIYENIHHFVEEANQAGVPVFSFYKTGVSEGAVAALSSDFFSMAEELLAPMAERVLADKIEPGAMPAAFLKKNKLFVNRAQAERFGLTIPSELERVHDVIYIK